MAFKLFFTILMIFFLEFMVDVSAYCCRKDCWDYPYTCENYNIYKCGDCTSYGGYTGSTYCAYGPCNVFGCDCEGGCRTGSCFTEYTKIVPMFNEIDLNKDGKIDMNEAKKWFDNYGKGGGGGSGGGAGGIIINLNEEFNKLDGNHDGYIEPQEFDIDLKDVNNNNNIDHKFNIDYYQYISMNIIISGVSSFAIITIIICSYHIWNHSKQNQIVKMSSN